MADSMIKFDFESETVSRFLRASDPQLKQFQLEGVRDMGKIVGDGSYASVKELEFRGLKCVGKKLHPILFRWAKPQEGAELRKRFTDECKLLSQLHHPCIVQFLGVFFEDESQIDLPVLVMEYLHTTLAECLKLYGVLPEEITYGILRDVILGLRYLHEHKPSIIHRDLSANNVLLTTDMCAKISDLGVAKILNLSPSQITQRISTQAPGTPCYMPPEALISKPSYTSKIDIYSYGVLIIHVLCGKWPFPGDLFRSNPQSPGLLLPVSEVDRRAEYLQEIGLDHPLMDVIRRCLNNDAKCRPEASEIHRDIETQIAHLPASFGNKVRMIRQLSGKGEVGDATDGGGRDDGSHLEALKSQIEEQRKQIKESQSKIEEQRKEIERQRRIIEEQAKGSQSHRSSSVHSIPHWKRCADLPVVKTQHTVLFAGSNVYIGAGYTQNYNNDRHSTAEDFLVFRYNPTTEALDTLPPCPVWCFGLAQFQGHLITVGGVTHKGVFTGKVHRYNGALHKWQEFLKPLPTPRRDVAVITTETAIVTCGGDIRFGANSNTVEVYTTGTNQWHTSDPLPYNCDGLTSVVIAGTCYLLGGNSREEARNVYSAHVSSLVEAAISPRSRASTSSSSVWKTLPNAPLYYSTAACLDDQLVAVGGREPSQVFPAIHVFVPHTNSWRRIPSWDLPVELYKTAAIVLPNKTLLVCGGLSPEFSKRMFVGEIY